MDRHAYWQLRRDMDIHTSYSNAVNDSADFVLWSHVILTILIFFFIFKNIKITGDQLQKYEHGVRHINFNRVNQELAKI